MNVIIDYGDGSQFAYGKLCYHSNTAVVVYPEYVLPNKKDVTLRFPNPKKLGEMIKFKGKIVSSNKSGIRVEGASEIESAIKPEDLAPEIVDSFDKSVTAALVHPSLNLTDVLHEVIIYIRKQANDLTDERLSNINMFQNCLPNSKMELFWDDLYSTFGNSEAFDKIMDFCLANSYRLKALITSDGDK